MDGEHRGASTRPHRRTEHAPRDGDSAIVAATRDAVGSGADVTVITADRGLQTQVQVVGARTMSPGWLLDQIG